MSGLDTLFGKVENGAGSFHIITSSLNKLLTCHIVLCEIVH